MKTRKPTRNWQPVRKLRAFLLLFLVAKLASACANTTVVISEPDPLPTQTVGWLEAHFDSCDDDSIVRWQRDFCLWYWYQYEPWLDAVYRAQGGDYVEHED